MKKLKLICIQLLIFTSFISIAQNKIEVNKADDLPRRSVTLNGTAVDIVNDNEQLLRLTNELIKNLEEDLDTYQINDKASLKSYYISLATCYMYKKDLEKAINLINKARDFEDKEGSRLTMGLFIKSFNSAYNQNKDITSDQFKDVFTKSYTDAWEKLPYEKIKDELESQRGSLSIFNPNLITSSLESQIQPYLDNNNNVVPEGLVLSFIGIRLELDYRSKLVPSMLNVINTIYEANKSSIVKKDIWLDRDVSLNNIKEGKPAVVAVWDSGTDVSVFPESLLHKDKDGKNGIGYDLIKYKNDGLLLDDPKGKINSEISRLQLLTKGFMDLQASIESPEVMEVRKTMASLKPEEAQAFQEELGFYGNYAHGTHVAGIAMRDNPFARLLVVRMGFDYRSQPPAHTLDQAKFQADMYKDIVAYLKLNKVRVVNMSWRYGVAAYEGLLALNGVGKDEEDRKKMARKMFEIEKKALYNAFKSAPEILFICGAGNENNAAEFVEYIPASFHDLPNLITIGAVDNEGKKTSFTTEGKGINIYANGFEIESYVPGGAKVKFSGTSMASPNVANLAAKILALKPNLTPEEVIKLIEKGSDPLPEDPNLLLLNPRKTLQLIDPSIGSKSVSKLSLLKRWKPDTNTAKLMVQDYLEQVKSQSPEQAKAMEAQKGVLEQMFAQIIFEYKADGSLDVNIPNSPKQVGTWKLSEDNKMITTQMAGQSENESIEILSENELHTISSKGKKYKYIAQ